MRCSVTTRKRASPSGSGPAPLPRGPSARSSPRPSPVRIHAVHRRCLKLYFTDRCTACFLSVVRRGRFEPHPGAACGCRSFPLLRGAPLYEHTPTQTRTWQARTCPDVQEMGPSGFTAVAFLSGACRPLPASRPHWVLRFPFSLGCWGGRVVALVVLLCGFHWCLPV